MNKIYTASVPISSGQWSFVLTNNKITTKSTLKLLRYLLKCPGYTERAGIIAIDPEFGYISHHPLNRIAGRFGSRVAELFDIPIPLSPYDGEKCSWHIPFLGEEIEPGHYTWTLRPELAKALIEID